MNILKTKKVVLTLVVTMGLCLAGAAPAEAAVPGLGICYRNAPLSEGVEVVAVFAGGQAERCGLEVGDRIISINGYPVIDIGNYSRVIAASGPVVRLLNRKVRTGGFVIRTAHVGVTPPIAMPEREGESLILP